MCGKKLILLPDCNRRKIYTTYFSVFALLFILAGCQGVESFSQSGNQTPGDFKVVDGQLIAYFGYETEIVVPEDVTEIAHNAFSNSPRADEITQISFGANVKQISPLAFSGLTALRTVVSCDENDFFQSEKEEFGKGTFLCGVNDPIMFYFSKEDNLVYLSDDVNQKPYSYGEGVEVDFICDNAIFTIFYSIDDDDNLRWYCRSICYEDNRIDFLNPIDFFGGNYKSYVFETKTHELVFEQTNNNFSDAYILTRNVAIELHPENDPNYSISLYCGDDRELRYKKIRADYSALEQLDEITQIIINRDDYYGEDGVVSIEGKKLVLVPENKYTISDYIETREPKMHT